MLSLNKPFYTALLVEFTAFLIIRRFIQYKLIQEKQKATLKSSPLDKALVIMNSIALFGGTLVYLAKPHWLSWATWPLPTWARWGGVALGGLGIAGFLWVHWALGKNWSAWLEIKANQNLVTTGPYQKIRHPMYTTIFLIYFGWALLTANWFLALTWIGPFALLTATRVKQEETMMLETFGETYSSYMQKTTRFLPKLNFIKTEQKKSGP